MTMFHHLLLQIHDFPGMTKATVAWLAGSIGVWGIGQSGVHLFFVLSGFLLFLPYARTLLGLQHFPDTRKFYIRRARRILPAYWVSLLLIVILFVPQYLDPLWPHLISHLLLIHDFSQATFNSISSPYWTMAIESHFYLLLPPLAGLFYRLFHTGRRLLLTGLILLLVAVSPLFSRFVVLVRPSVPHLLDYIGFLSLLRFLCVFILGMLCSILYVAATQDKLKGISPQRLQIQCKLLSIAGLVLLLMLMVIHAGALPVQNDEFYLYNLILGFAYAGILLGTVLGWPSWRRVLASRALRFIGVISYSLYIWNAPLYSLVVVPLSGVFGSDLVTFLLSVCLTGLITIPFCWVFYQCVERPFLTVRRIQNQTASQ